MAQNIGLQQNAVNQAIVEPIVIDDGDGADNNDELLVVEENRDNNPVNGNIAMNMVAGNNNRPPIGAVAGVPNRNLNGNGNAAAMRVEGAVAPGPPAREFRQPAVVGVMPVAVSRPYYNWQATKATLKDRFQYLHNNEILSDVRFIVGKGMQTQRIPAHKFVLSAGSAVFDAMFNGILATQSNEVELPDVEPAAFIELLRFLYTDEVNIGPETVMTTLYTAKKYAVPALESHCVDFLKKNLGPHNAFMLLTQARLFDEPQLASLCLESIDQNTAEALSADGFTDIDLETLISVLERDTLGIRESKLFVAAENWAEAECERQELEVTKENKRKVLGNAINLIRFPIMSIEEFAQGPAQSGVLTEREVVDLFLYFHLNPKPRVRFTDRPRCCLTGKEQCVYRFVEVAQRWGYSGASDRIRFKVNRKIHIVGFGLYGAIHGPADYQVNLQIVMTESGTVIAQNDTGFSSDGTDKRFRVMLKEPVEISPNVNYTACATLNGPDSYYGTRGHRKVAHESPNGSRTVFNFAFSPGNNNGTSVEDGQIPEIIFYM